MVQRPKTDIAHPMTHKDFYYLAFPLLYPYGRGEWSIDCGITEDEYSKYALELADTRFQSCPSFYFALYHYFMQKRVGGISALAASKSTNANLQHRPPVVSTSTSSSPNVLREMDSIASADCPPDITVGDMRNLLSNCVADGAGDVARQAMSGDILSKFSKLLARRLTTYADSVPGTAAHINLARRKILTMLTSPIIKDVGSFTWFCTYAMADVYDTIVYAIALHDYSTIDGYDGIDGSYVKAKSLSLARRLEILRQSPAIVARVFMLKHKAFWDCIANGYHKPLGIWITIIYDAFKIIYISVYYCVGDIVDFFIRVEFQMRGTPHMHFMVTNRKDEGIVPQPSDIHDEQKKEMVLQYVNKHVTAMLQPREVDDFSPYEDDHQRCTEELREREKLRSYNVDSKYFDDRRDPRREMFLFETHDYSLCPEGKFEDARVQAQYRNLQLANQMHRYCSFHSQSPHLLLITMGLLYT